jgi:hypothetical protein
MSGKVGIGTGRSGVVENVEDAVGSSMIPHSIPEKPRISVLAVVSQTNPLVSGHVTVESSVT